MFCLLTALTAFPDIGNAQTPPLVIKSVSVDTPTVVAVLPAPVAVMPGTYLLTVSAMDPAASGYDRFNVSIGTGGAAGPKGDTGPAAHWLVGKEGAGSLLPWTSVATG
ncbi:hypothetical protein COEX109129_25570 [Corallococcus exiguus]